MVFRILRAVQPLSLSNGTAFPSPKKDTRAHEPSLLSPSPWQPVFDDYLNVYTIPKSSSQNHIYSEIFRRVLCVSWVPSCYILPFPVLGAPTSLRALPGSSPCFLLLCLQEGLRAAGGGVWAISGCTGPFRGSVICCAPSSNARDP